MSKCWLNKHPNAQRTQQQQQQLAYTSTAKLSPKLHLLEKQKTPKTTKSNPKHSPPAQRHIAFLPSPLCPPRKPNWTRPTHLKLILSLYIYIYFPGATLSELLTRSYSDLRATPDLRSVSDFFPVGSSFSRLFGFSACDLGKGESHIERKEDRMGTLGALLKHPDDLYPLLKLKMAMRNAGKQIPPDPHWGFCYSMLHKVSRSFALVIQQLGTELRNAVCIFYLVLRALDTVEDDTSIPTDVKVPILIAFHKHIYDNDWHFSCGTKEYKVLMDQFHHVSTAFLELDKGYQEAIEDITKRMGAGMAKFICKEVESVSDYDEYCHYVAGLVGLGLSKLFHASGLEDLAPDHLSNSMGLFLQKTNIIRDYLEDINEIPKSRMFWPREIWSKYVNKLEDLKYEENSEMALRCLNDMVANALIHMEDCIKYMSALKDHAIFRFCAIPQIMAIGTLALCYNNIQVFRGVVKMRRGLTARVINQTNKMADVYGAFFDFACMLKSKIDKDDPNATTTINRIEGIQKICRNSGTLSKRNLYILRNDSQYRPLLMIILIIIMAILLSRLSDNQPNN